MFGCFKKKVIAVPTGETNVVEAKEGMGTKFISVPTGDTKEVVALDNWVVSWKSKHGEYKSDYRQEFEVFLNEDDAKDFKKSLEDAFKILKYSHESIISVKITKS